MSARWHSTPGMALRVESGQPILPVELLPDRAADQPAHARDQHLGLRVTHPIPLK
jgi:hypothetical protein